MSGKVKAFASFGVTLKNEQWSWSGRTEDGRRVVLTLWKDQIDYKTKPVSCDLFRHPQLADWKDRHGNRERIENLIWARDHCDGMFSVVVATAKDQFASVREIDEAYPIKLKMRLTTLDEQTGEFRAEAMTDAVS